ncbi:MAG: hypothetical protein QM763_14415 [Agriterribacter sp.]
MSYELSKIEKLIQSTAYQKEVNKEGTLPDEVNRIKNVWRVIACSEHDAGFLKNYVRQHQLGLISIAEAISDNASDIPDAFSTIEGYNISCCYPSRISWIMDWLFPLNPFFL